LLQVDQQHVPVRHRFSGRIAVRAGNAPENGKLHLPRLRLNDIAGPAEAA
jgi:hypothetical protein